MTLDELGLAKLCVEKLMNTDRLILAGLGVAVELVECGRVVIAMKVSAAMVTSQNICHGGFLFTLADTACAYVSASKNAAPVTTEANISFIAPAMLNDLVRAEARIEYTSERTIHSVVRVTKGDNQLVALYKGTNLNRGKCIEE